MFRYFLGFLIAPLAAALVLFVAGEIAVEIAPSEMDGSERYHFEFLMFTLLVSYAAAILLGGPVLLVLLKLHWTGPSVLMTCGALVGVLPVFATKLLDIPPTNPMTPEQSLLQFLGLLLTTGVAGSIAGFVFWLAKFRVVSHAP